MFHIFWVARKVVHFIGMIQYDMITLIERNIVSLGTFSVSTQLTPILICFKSGVPTKGREQSSVRAPSLHQPWTLEPGTVGNGVTC